MRSQSLPLNLFTMVCGVLLWTPQGAVGEDLIGQKFGTTQGVRWVRPATGSLEFAENDWTLLRWWTDECPHCEKSLPALSHLAAQYDSVRLVGVYHPKSPGKKTDAQILDWAEELGLDGDVAIDEEWELLRRVWLDTGNRRATSVTFLADRDGIIRYIHPGPLICRPEDFRDSEANNDYRKLDTFLAQRVRETNGKPKGGKKRG